MIVFVIFDRSQKNNPLFHRHYYRCIDRKVQGWLPNSANLKPVEIMAGTFCDSSDSHSAICITAEKLL